MHITTYVKKPYPHNGLKYQIKIYHKIKIGIANVEIDHSSMSIMAVDAILEVKRCMEMHALRERVRSIWTLIANDKMKLMFL